MVKAHVSTHLCGADQSRGFVRFILKYRLPNADGTGMNHPLTMGSLVLALAVSACSSTDSKLADFALNDLIYKGTTYTSRMPGDRTLFLAPIVDNREQDGLPATQGAYPIVYDDESRWNRTVAEMLDDVLHKDLQQSHVFSSFVDSAANADVVIQPTLITFLTGSMELESGSRALSELGMKLQVLGSIGFDGQRTVLFERLYGERQLTDPAMRPPSRVMLTGRVLTSTMQKLVRSIDGSNVGRSGLPLMVPAVLPVPTAKTNNAASPIDD